MRGLGFGICVLGIAVGMSACSSATPEPKKSATKAPGSSSPAKALQSQYLIQAPKVRIDLLALSRVSDQVVTAKFRATNQGTDDFTFGVNLRGMTSNPSEVGAIDQNAVSGISLFDGAGMRQYFPLIGSNGKCLCTRSDTFIHIAAGQSFDLAAAFPAPPAGTDRLSVLFPNAAPFVDMPVGKQPGETIDIGDENHALDPAKAQNPRTRVLPVISRQESTTQVQEDNGTDVSVRISADVLFALNKADLSPSAQSILRDVAGQIDHSPGNTVRIDGYTDNTGNDAINNPLSEQRAQSVENALKGLVTRPGVSYQSKGHGSADPVAPNDTDKGRQLNRRVTVTFTRPKPAVPAPPSAGPATGPAQTTVKLGAKPESYLAADQWPAAADKTTANIGALRRDSDGFTVLTVVMHNDDPAVLDLSSLLTAPSPQPHWGSGVSGITLTNASTRFWALRNADGVYLSTNFDQLDSTDHNLGQGKTITLTAIFRLPPDLTSVTVNVPGFETAQNIPVG